MASREIRVLPTEQKRTLRAAIFVDLWNLLRGAKGNIGPLAPTFDWDGFVQGLRSAAAQSFVGRDYYAPKADQVHLIHEGAYVYGAPSPKGVGPGSQQWLNDAAGLPGFTVHEDHTKVEKYECRKCQATLRIRRESGTDAHLISDLMWLAWQDRYDVAIVVSGDADLIPSIERIQLSGRKVVAALFDGTSNRTRRIAHSSVGLNDILLDFRLYGSKSRLSEIARVLAAHLPTTYELRTLIHRYVEDIDSLESTVMADLPSLVQQKATVQGPDPDFQAQAVKAARAELPDIFDALRAFE